MFKTDQLKDLKLNWVAKKRPDKYEIDAGCDKRFKARWTDSFGGETTDVNKSLSPPHDLGGIGC